MDEQFLVARGKDKGRLFEGLSLKRTADQIAYPGHGRAENLRSFYEKH